MESNTTIDRPNNLAQRLIGFFDILGFSERLRTMDVQDLHHSYAQLIDDAQHTVFRSEILGVAGGQKVNFDRAQFLFDSIVLVSRDLTNELAPAAVFDFLMSCTSLMEKSFGKQLPLRGVIGFGDYLEDNARKIFLSREFAEIVIMEKAQEWSGCILLPQAAEKILPVVFLKPDAPTHREGRSMTLVSYNVPFKSGHKSLSTKYWCINWVYLLDPSAKAAGLSFLKPPKLEHTRAFVNYVEGLPDEDRLLPEKFLPAVRVLAQGTLGGVCIKFVDAMGNGVDPPAGPGLRITLVAGEDAVVFPGPPITNHGTGAA